MTKIQVPEGMLEAAEARLNRTFTDGREDVTCQVVLEAALQWLDGELEQMRLTYRIQQAKRGYPLTGDAERLSGFEEAIDRVRRMFLAEPEVPEEVKDLLIEATPENQLKLLEAFRRGQGVRER